MNPDFVPVADDSVRAAQLLLYTTATPLQIIQGIATGAFDLSPYVKAMKQKPAQLEFTLTWHSELNGKVPVSGNLVGVNLGSQLLWTGIVAAVASYQSDRGTRELQITARTRDGNALWRTTPRVSDIYPAGTQLTYIAQQLCSAIGLSAAEMVLPAVSAYTVHNNVQMSNLSIWDMLTTLYQPVGYQPYIDGYGRVKCVSRDTQRGADITITNDRTVAIKGSYSQPQKTAARVKWLDPNLSQVIQPAQSLMTASLTAGFFQPTVTKDITFSTDGTQQAINTYLVIKQSCNSGLLPVATESYEQLTPTTGRITLTNTYFSAAFIVSALGGIVAASFIPDTVVLDVVLAGHTISVGRLIEGASLFAAMLAMSSIGTGSYEIWGNPSSWVHQTNTTEAYDITAPAWQEDIVQIDNDFVMSEAMSEAFATRELLYEVQSAINYEGQIVDDPRIEVGDILQLPDGSLLYVLDYERDLGRGAAAILDVTGFQAGAIGSVIANIAEAQTPVTGTATTAQGQFAGVFPPITGTAATAQGQSASSTDMVVPPPVPASGRKATLLSIITNTAGIFSGQHTEHWPPGGTAPMATVNAVKSLTGKDVAIISVSDQAGSADNIPAEANAWQAKGGIVQVTWNPHDPSTGLDANSTVDLAQIYTPGGTWNATWNAYIDARSAVLNQIGGPYFLRPFCEMNGNWSWWGDRDPTEFKHLWVYTYNRLKANGVLNNALFVFSANSFGNAAQFWPGSQYVDVCAWDAYPPTAGDTTYTFLASTGLPVYLSETGVESSNNNAVAPFSGDNSQLLAYVKAHFPKVFAVLVFCQDWAIPKQNGASAFMNNTLDISKVPPY